MNFILKFLRKLYFRNKRDLKPQTLICNNCLAGCVLHDYNMRFDTPTINLWIPFPDYMKFLKRLKFFINADFQEIKEDGINYPIGLLGGEVKVYFLHYHSFEEAVNKWKQRAKRIHWDNIKFILVERDGCSSQDLIDFDSLPLANKVALTRTNDLNLNSAFHIKGYDNKEELGDIMFFKGVLGRRIYDQYDWYSFLKK